MNRAIIVLFLLISPLIINAQSKQSDVLPNNINKKIDSITNIQNILLKKQNSFENSLEQSKSVSDSLKRELLFYKVKEDFYATALSDQSTRFTLIISGILALFALLSFGAFKYEVSKIRESTEKRILKYESKVNKYKIQLKETTNQLIGAKGNLFTSIATSFEKEKSYVSAFRYFIFAARAHGEFNKNRKLKEFEQEVIGNKYRTAISNLHFAKKCLLKISTKEQKIDLKSKIVLLEESIDIMNNFSDTDIKHLISEIRIGIKDKLKNDA